MDTCQDSSLGCAFLGEVTPLHSFHILCLSNTVSEEAKWKSRKSIHYSTYSSAFLLQTGQPNPCPQAIGSAGTFCCLKSGDFPLSFPIFPLKNHAPPSRNEQEDQRPDAVSPSSEISIKCMRVALLLLRIGSRSDT